MKKTTDIYQSQHDLFSSRLKNDELSIKEKIANLENFVSKSNQTNKTDSLRFVHRASVNYSTEKLSRSQIAQIKAQNMKNFINFIIALVFFTLISCLLFIGL